MEPERSEARLEALGRLLRSSVEAPSLAALERGLGRLRAGLSAPRSKVRRAGLLAAAALAVVAAAVLALRLRPGPALPLKPVSVARVEGGKILEGGYLSETGHSGVRLLFSEGSKFVLAPGTRGRLRSVAQEGARLTLDRGTASFQITPNHERRWQVEAGPFEVTVRGTDFTVVWDPASEALSVKLRQGRVAVSGPLVGEELVLRPGENLSVDLARRQTVISEDRAEEAHEQVPVTPAPTSAPAEPESTASATVAPTSAPAQASASAGAPARRWREALASGQWDRILADVERDGVETSLRTLSADELFVLADAARYRRRTDLARSALLAARERFPRSPRALDATFLLGRVEELRADGKIAAMKRYDEYLRRAPNGTYSAEALGRKMILMKELEGPESARRIAEDYLQRFPGGSYAEAARSLQRVR